MNRLTETARIVWFGADGATIHQADYGRRKTAVRSIVTALQGQRFYAVTLLRPHGGHHGSCNLYVCDDKGERQRPLAIVNGFTAETLKAEIERIRAEASPVVDLAAWRASAPGAAAQGGTA